MDPRLLALARPAPLVLPRRRSSRLLLLPRVSLARGRRRARVRLPFPLPPEAPAAQEEKVREPGRSLPDAVTPCEGWGLPVSALEAVAVNWSGVLGGDRPSGRLSRPVHGLSSSPSSHTGIVSDVPGRLSSGSSLAARGRGDACQRSLRNRPRSGSRLLQSPLPGGGGGWRPGIDLSHLNDFVQLTSFKMETVASVLLSVREGDFLASLDLKDAYFQIPIHGSSRKLLRFMSEGTVYQFKALCSGLSTAPQVFTRVFAAVSAWAHSRGIRLLRYLDDWLVLSSSEKKAKQSVRELLSLCHTLGIVINEKKSDLVSSQAAKYLGMTIDTVAGKVFPSLARVEKFLSVAERFCSMQSPPAQLWQVILGHLASLERLVPHGRLRMRSLQWHLKTQWSPRVSPSLASGVFAGGSETGSVLVDGEGPPVDGGSIRDTCVGSSPVFGRVFVGVGCSPPRSKRVRGVVRPGEVAAHQSSQNEGPVPGSSGISRRCQRSPCDRDVRQLHGCGVRQQTGGHGFPGPVFVDQPPSEMDGEFRRPSRCEVSARREQRPGRCSQPSRASCRDRVVSPPSGGEITFSCVGQSVNRPVCDLPQREAAPVLLASHGSPGRLRGCVSPSLGRPGSVRVPSGRSGDRPRPAVVACHDDSGRASLARGVVRRLAASTDPTTPGSALLGQAASATPLQSVPSRRPRAEASCVETLKRHYRKSGFSGRAARVLSGVLRKSSSRLYQSRWKIFCGWCRGRGVAPVNATVPVVVDFLIHLRQDKGLSVSAVVLALKGRDLAASREITTLLRSFSRSVNPVELRPPAWDVSLVLQSLTGAPYEPLRTCEERFLAQKTLFLLALASAKRIGELHALSYRVSYQGLG